MKFRTEVEPAEPSFQIEHKNRIFTAGSCFAENIAEYFRFYRFALLSNPFGVLYNPVSILNSVKIVKSKKRFLLDDLVFHQSEYHSFYHHSDFSNHNREECLRKINSGIDETYSYLNETDVIIISYGTSFVYKHKERGIIVSNNHKISANEFQKFRLSVEEIIENVNETINLLKEFNPDLKIVFTVSPVRHWRDGAVENQLSKSSLLLAMEQIAGQNTDIYYFPSYEILMDDLRDYRFYAEDLVHPNKQAVEYIWEKFKNIFFDDENSGLMNEIGKIARARSHRVRNAQSGEHHNFIKIILSKIDNLEEKYPHLNLSDDRKYFEKQIL